MTTGIHKAPDSFEYLPVRRLPIKVVEILRNIPLLGSAILGGANIVLNSFGKKKYTRLILLAYKKL